MSMLTPNDKFTFGKHKGKLIRQVMSDHPDYIYWMHCSGFSDFGKEITEFIFQFEELFPAAAEKVKRKVAAKKATASVDTTGINVEAHIAHLIPKAPTTSSAALESWGSW